MQKTLKQLTCAAFAVGALASCNEYVDYVNDAQTSTQASYQEKLEEFASNFEKEFGKPDPNHTWGWGDMTPELADAILGENATRASWNPGKDPVDEAGYIHTDPTGNQEGRILVNHNQWAEWDNQTNDYKSYSIARMVHIPGWPNEDGQYIANGTPVEHNGKYFGTPKGDISEYEIQYVSWWMRNHPFDPQHPEDTRLQLVDLHVSEFFIQQVSHDKDYTDYSSTSSPVSMDWFGGGNDWSMNQLKFKALDGNWTHINNFNGNENDVPQSHIGSNNGRVIQYVMSSGTEDFNYHSTTSTNGYTFDKWVMVKIEWDEPRNPNWNSITSQAELEAYLASTKSDTFHRVGYYLCFDFQADKSDNNATNPGMDLRGDNVYSNWILKITPGKQVQIDRWPKRLMCEDLGNTFDFDFNDAVFDLFFQENANTSGSYDCIVTLQAAGGTMPIWVAIDPKNPGSFDKDASEIHQLLGGYPSTTPVNVIAGGAAAPFASYRIKNMFQSSDAQNMYTKDADGNWIANTNYSPTDALMTKMAAAAFKLSIYVETPTGIESVSGYKIFQSLRNGNKDTEPPYQNGFNGGNKSSNYAPQLFNCSVDAHWTYENGHINEAYPYFKEWVKDEQGAYRLRWDATQYYERTTVAGQGEESVGLVPNTNEWKGSWDFGPKNNASWGLDDSWTVKSKLYRQVYY